MPDGPTRLQTAQAPTLPCRAGDTTRGRKSKVVGVMVAATVVLGGCSVGPRNFANDNDALREQNLKLTQRIEALQEQLDSAEARVRSLSQRLDRPAPALPGIGPADIPQLTRIQTDRYSGTIDDDGNGKPDTVRLYLTTLDQRGRFIPVTGSAIVQVVSIIPGHPPAVLAEKAFDPADLDRAYRHGLTGTHYTLDVPLTQALPTEPRVLTANTTLTDGATGAAISHAHVLLPDAAGAANPN